MPSCAVAICTNSSRNQKERGFKMFSFPKDPVLCKKWKVACRRKDRVNCKNAVVCSDHFTPEDRLKPIETPLCVWGERTRILKTTAVPTLRLGNKMKEKSASDVARERAEAERKRKALIEEILEADNIMEAKGDALEPLCVLYELANPDEDNP